MIRNPAFGIILSCFLVQSTLAQELPTAPQRPLFVAKDWLLDASPYVA